MDCRCRGVLHLAPLLSAEARPREKADAGRGLNSRPWVAVGRSCDTLLVWWGRSKLLSRFTRRANQRDARGFICRVLFFGFSEIFRFRLPQITPTSLPILSHRGAYPDRQRRGAGGGGRGGVRRES